MTHGLMLKDRVPTSQHTAGPMKRISELTPEDILPTVEDYSMLEKYFIRVLCNIWAGSISWMETQIPRHKNSRHTHRKTELVSSTTVLGYEHQT